MATANVKSLVGKLNDVCRRALDDAAGLCVSRTNYNVEVEHWLLRLLDAPNTDLLAILAYFGADPGRLKKDLTRVVDQLKTGNARVPALSPNLVTLSREAWLIASLDGSSRTRSGHLLQALMSEESLARLAREGSDEFDKIAADVLAKDFDSIATGAAELEQSAGAGAGGGAVPSKRPASTGGSGKSPALDQFTIDLTERARSGHIDPVLGRDSEIRQVIDILTRRRQNNPLLAGEAGVGKTAVVEGFALRVAAGDVPPSLAKIAIRTLDLGLLQAGAGVKGEFENRLKNVIDEVKASPQPVVLFIDEAHTMIGAGGQAGQGDAANLLKPALARGELRTIAATTWAEYKEYFEKDAALARRFQVVKVDEPGEEAAVQMMRGLVATLERHHKVEILDEAVTDAVRLSHRYISGRQLPDKSVSLLDTACARVAIRLASVPPPLEDARRRLEQTNVTIDILTRESAATADHVDRLGELQEQKKIAESEVQSLSERWEKESKLIQDIRGIRAKLGAGFGPSRKDEKNKAAGSKPGEVKAVDGKPVEGKPVEASKADAPMTEAERNSLRAQAADLSAKLKQLQGETPLAQVCVDGQAIAEVVAGWTGIPVGRMVADEIKTVLNIKAKLEERIIGQTHALEAIGQSVRTSRARLTDPRKPIGVFLMVGTSGVGKTETAIALAELLYGGDQNMTVINMSEFKEEHKVSLLMGSPPGYVGFGKGGVLTEAVRRKPYSVVLLDEMEKAHPGIQDIFYQVFDKGIMRDSEGRDIDFKNTLILMTSNAGTDLITKLCADPETRPNAEGLAEQLLPELQKTFKPAFLGRVTVVPYFPLADDVMRKIIELQLGRVKRRVRDNYKALFTYDPKVVDSIAERCREVSTGARNVDHILTRTLLPELSAEFLARMADGQGVKSVNVTLGENSGFRYEIA